MIIDYMATLMLTRDNDDTQALLRADNVDQSTHSRLNDYFRKLRAAIIETEPASLRPSWLMRAALPTAIEGPIAFGSSYASFYFMDADTSNTGWLKTPFTPAIMLLLMSLLFRTFNFDTNFLRFTCARLPRCIATLISGYLIRHTLFHEGGHAIAALALFENSNPQIMIERSYFGAITATTRYSISALSPLGQHFGMQTSTSIVSAAGMSVSMLEAYLFLIIAQCIPNSFTEIKDYLRANALMDIIGVLSYTLTPYFFDCEDKNDVCVLEQNGIPAYAGFLLVFLSSALLQIILHFVPKGIQYLKDKLIHTNDEMEELIFETPDDITSINYMSP